MKFALFIPTLNAGSRWVQVIEAIQSQLTFPDAVLVADSGSIDETAALASSTGFEVMHISPDDFDHGGTRQLALQYFIGFDVIVYMTQDAILSNSESFENLLTAFNDASVAAVCGRQIPSLNAGYIESHSRIYNYPEQSLVRSFSDRKTVGLKAAFLSNSFAAYRVSALNEVGGFPEDVIFGEDMYVAAKLLKAGYKIAYAAEACVYHSHNYSLRQEFKRYFDMGVFHAREPWLREEFGSAENQGTKFVVSELRYLLRHAFWRIPEALLRTMFKFAGFKFGKFERLIPVFLKKYMSMNSVYFMDARVERDTVK